MCSMAGQVYLETGGTLRRRTDERIAALMACSREKSSTEEIQHPAAAGTICFQQDQHWFCFQGNIIKTAYRQGGARKGLFKRCDAILSGSWKPE